MVSNRKRLCWLGCSLLLTISLQVLISHPGKTVAQTSTETPTPTPSIQTPTSTPLANASPPDAGPVLKVNVAPDPLVASQTAEIEFTLKGQRGPTARCYGPPARPLDLIFVVDNSPSADSGQPGSNLAQTRHILQDFVTQSDQDVYVGVDLAAAQKATLKSHRSRIGLLTTRVIDSHTETAWHSLTEDYQQVREAISEISSGGEIELDEGIKQATTALRQRTRPGAQQVLVLLLHDRAPIDASVITMTQEARHAGIDVYLFSNDLNIPTEEAIDAETAQQLVDVDHFVSTFASEQLRRVFVQMSGGSPDLVAREILLTAAWLPPGMEALGLAPDAIAAQDVVFWRVAQLTHQEEETFRYTARVSTELEEDGFVSADVFLAYLDCNGFWRERFEIMPFQVIKPTSTPTPTPPLPTAESIPTPLQAITPSSPPDKTPPAESPQGTLQAPDVPEQPGEATTPSSLPMKTPPGKPPQATLQAPDAPKLPSEPIKPPPTPPVPHPWESIGWLSFFEPLIGWIAFLEPLIGGNLLVILEWVLIIIAVILVVALLAFLIWKLIQLLRKRRSKPSDEIVDEPRGPRLSTSLPPTAETTPQWLKNLTSDKKILK